MTAWKNSKDNFPPMEKKVLIRNPDGSMYIATLQYAWKFDDNNRYGAAISEDNIRGSEIIWMEIPE